MFENIKFVAITASIFVCFFWAVALLIGPARKNKSNIYVIILLFITTFVYAMVYTKFKEYFSFYGTFFPLQALFTLSLFPLFYLYIHSLTKHLPAYKHVYLWHFFMPFIFFVLMLFILFLWMNAEERGLFISGHIFNQNIEGTKYRIGLLVYETGKKFYIISSVFYTWFIYKDYKNHLKKSKNIFSNIDDVDLGWLRIMFVFYLFLLCFHLAIQVFSNSFVARQDLLVFLSYLIFTIFFYALGYFSFVQKQIYPSQSVNYEIEKGLVSKTSIEDIVSYFKEEKPFLNPEFSLYDLCLKFNTNRSFLSSLINQGFNMNFRTLINTYRLNEAKLLLKAEVLRSNYISMEYIAIKSGFNSYGTFARVFKQFEGIAPCVYRDKLAQE